MYTKSYYARYCEWCGALLYWDEDIFCTDRWCINDYYDYLFFWYDDEEYDYA